MRYYRLTSVFIMILFVTGCNDLFILSRRELRNSICIYTTDSLGSNIRFTFDSSGKSGSFEEIINTYGYPTAEAAATAYYAAQTYYQIDGTRGTFVYDPDTYRITMSITDRYQLRTGATSGFENDYSWYSLLESEQNHSSPSISSCNLIIETVFVPNSDIPIVSTSMLFDDPIARPLLDDRLYLLLDDILHSSFSSTKTITDNGIATTSMVNMQKTLTIDASAIEVTLTGTKTITVDSIKQSTQNTQAYGTYKINNLFIKGQTTGTSDFHSIWKKGNSITFLTERIKEEIIQYSGDVAPTQKPEILQYTGSGSASGMDWSWQINLVPSAQEPITLIHYGDFVLDASIIEYAFRNTNTIEIED